MLEDLRKKQKYVIIFIAFVFIVGMGIMGLTDIFFIKKPVLGKIDGVKITYEMFQEEFQKNVENYRLNNPDAEMSRDLLSQLSDQTWQRMKQQIILGKQMKKLRIKVTDEEVLAEIQNNPPQELMQNPALQTNERFDRKKYLTALKENAEFFAAMEEYVRGSLPFNKLMERIKKDAKITTDSLKAEYLKENDEMYGKLIVFDFNKLPKPEVSDTEIKNEYDKIKDTDKEIKKGKSSTMKFLLFEVKPSDADFNAIKRDIDDIYAMIQKGDDFGQLAKDYSEDTGSAEQFGSLGTFGKGQMVPEFEQMAFSMQPGEVSQPFKTNFGWHILKVHGFSTNENGEQQVAASHILKKVEASFDTIDMIEQQAKNAAKLVKKEGIDKAAKELKMEPTSTDAIYEDSEFIPGLGQHATLLEFAKKKKAGAVSGIEKDRRGNFIVAQITEKSKDPFVPLDKVKMRIKYDLERKKLIAAMQPIAQQFVKNHKPEEFLVAAAKDSLVKIVNLQNFKNNTTIPEVGRVPEVNTEALKLAEGQVSNLIETEKGQFIIVSEKRTIVDINAFLQDADAQKKLRDRMEEQAWNRWYDAVMKKAEVIDNRQEYNLF